MNETSQQSFPQDEPALYRIQVNGLVDERMADWFDEMAITIESSPDGRVISCLSGKVADQAALHGLLSRIYTLGLLVIAVTRVEPTP